MFEPYFWAPVPSVQQQTHPLLALMMPEPLPSIALIDRAEVIRGRTESSSNNAAQEVAAARELLLQPNSRSKRSSGDPVWDPTLGGVAGDMGGIEITVFEGELIVTIQSFSESSSTSQPPSRSTSRPPSSITDVSVVDKPFSRSPSIRMRRPGTKGLERKPSTINRRNSLPSVPSNPEELMSTQPSSERPLRVGVKAGTLERLVDVLLHGLQGISIAFSDDNGEMPLRDGKHRDLKVDHSDFSTVWWNSFRSFVTPLVLFEVYTRPSTLPPIPEVLAVAAPQTISTSQVWVGPDLREKLRRNSRGPPRMDSERLRRRRCLRRRTTLRRFQGVQLGINAGRDLLRFTT